MIEKFVLEVDPRDDEERAMVETVKAEMREEARMMMTPQAIGRELANRINRAQGVLSLSRANDTLLMWAHYGDAHKGYVIGFDDTHAWFREDNGLGKHTKSHNVVYTSRRTTIKAGSEDFYERLLCYKSLEWAYEQEVRIFRTFGRTQEQFDQNALDQVHLFAIPRDCIKEIYIGANANASLRESIFNAIYHEELDAKVYEAYVTEDRYAINFRLVTA